MTDRQESPFVRSRPNAFATVTTWRALSHGLQLEPHGKPRRTILWGQIKEIRLAVEIDRRDRRRRCDILTRGGDWLTIYGPAPGRLLDSEPGGDYAALVRETIARSRAANPSLQLIAGRFLGRLVIFHTITFATFVVFVEGIGRMSGMKSADPTGFAWLQFGSMTALALWSILVIVRSAPRTLEHKDIPADLLSA